MKNYVMGIGTNPVLTSVLRHRLEIEKMQGQLYAVCDSKQQAEDYDRKIINFALGQPFATLLDVYRESIYRVASNEKMLWEELEEMN